MIQNAIHFFIKTDIDLDAKWDAPRDADASVNRCVAAVTECLKSAAPNSAKPSVFTFIRYSYRFGMVTLPSVSYCGLRASGPYRST